MHDEHRKITGGVDTHRDVHVAAAVDATGRILGTHAFPATARGYRRLLRWLRRHGEVVRVGVEGTGAYGAGLARYLTAEGMVVVEVNRPDRQRRRRHGKSDPVDAESAARAALNGDAVGTPKTAVGVVEAIRALRVVRRSAIKARTQAANQIAALVVTAPAELREQLDHLSTNDRVGVCSRYRPSDVGDPIGATKFALRALARRHLELSEEIATLDTHLAQLCATANPGLIGAKGVGVDVASALLVTAGDNPERMRNEASFAALCGVSPVEASSGQIVRHRLNTGGDREANNALWRIVMVRATCDQRTKDYIARRRQEGRTNREIYRCLKRHVAREVFRLLAQPTAVISGADLQQERHATRASLRVVASALGTSPIHLSRLERGLIHDAELAARYNEWLTNRPAA